jgi:methylthioribose-1-phosphate isomerase
MNVTVRGKTQHYRTVTFDAARNEVRLIEQRLLPHEFKIVSHAKLPRNRRCHPRHGGARRRRDRRDGGVWPGAGRAGVSRQRCEEILPPRRNGLPDFEDARPTAVDPVNAMNDVRAAMTRGETVAEQQAIALAAAEEFAAEDAQHCEAIGRHGAKLIRDGMRVLTHCNAGWLAFVDVGSATAPMYAAQAAGKKFHVFCDETRPRSQGATLTAWELAQQGVSHQIIADNAAGHLMQRGEIDLVIVGSDRTLGRTGEVANKIGTYTKAVLAKRHQHPVLRGDSAFDD